MKIDPNETAHPALVRDQNGEYYEGGLTKLEWAAVQIMAGLDANPALDMRDEACAAVAVRRARALFAELEKQG